MQASTQVIQLLPPTHDNEWIKTIASLLVGIAVGTVSAFIIEPMKLKRQRKFEATLGEEAIYEELGRLLTAFRFTVIQPETHCEKLCQRIKFEKFDYYYQQRREVFYAMPDNAGIRSLHGQFALNLDPERVREYGAKHQVQELIDAYDYAIKLGEIDGKRIEAAAAKQDSESREKGQILWEQMRVKRQRNEGPLQPGD